MSTTPDPVELRIRAALYQAADQHKIPVSGRQVDALARAARRALPKPRPADPAIPNQAGELRDVLELLVDGFGPLTIAARTGLTVDQVRTRVLKLRRDWGGVTVSVLVAQARAAGVWGPESPASSA